MGDDAAALRGLQGRRGAPVLPRSFLPGSTARSCWSMRSRRSTPDRKRCTISKRRWRAFSIVSGSAAARFSAACSGRGSTASCLPPPRPIICIIPAMTGWRRCCGARSPRPPTRAEYAGAAIDVVALAAVRATREAQVARGREKLPSILGTPARRRESPMARRSTARPKSRPFRATCRPIPRRCSRRRRVSRPVQRSVRKGRFSLPALPAAAAGARRRRGARAASHPP